MGITINGSSAAGNIDLGTNGTIADLAVGGVPDGTIDRDALAADVIDGTKLADDAVAAEHVADDAVGVAQLSASGTASSSTYLRGDNSWATVSGSKWTDKSSDIYRDSKLGIGDFSSNALDDNIHSRVASGTNYMRWTTVSGGNEAKLKIGVNSSGDGIIAGLSDKALYVSTNSTERYRITGGGIFYSAAIYDRTTSTSANVHIKSDGELCRSTSSLKYKKDIVTLEDAKADNLIDNLRPVRYKPKTANSHKLNTEFYGLIAEEVNAVDPTLIEFNEADEPESVQYLEIIPALLNLVKRQKAQIATLETKVAALEAG